MHNAIFSDVFWTILVLFIVGLPLLRSTVKMPRKLVFNKVDDGALTPQQAAFFQKYDRELGDLGFYPALTYTVPNLSGKNLSRTYFSSAEPTRVNVCTMTSAKGGHAHSFVEVVTSWDDGTFLMTKNSDVSTAMFATPPWRVSQAFPGASVAELKRRHDAKRAAMSKTGECWVKPDDFFDVFAQYHKRNLDLQVSKGLFRPDGDIYRATLRLAFRSVQNFLNPLAGAFTLPRVATGALLGLAIPLFALTYPTPVASWISMPALAPAQKTLLTLGAYAIGGIAIGWFFARRQLVWSFLLGYIPLLFFPYRAGLGYVGVMAFIAHWTSQFRLKQGKLV